MKVEVLNLQGEVVRTAELPDGIFSAPVRPDLMHQALVRQQANARLGTHKTKTRSEVSGGGRKPWRQKGTGRARQGSTRSPVWVGGGKVHTPRPRDYGQRMPRKMRRAALRSALSAKAGLGQLVVVEQTTQVGHRMISEAHYIMAKFHPELTEDLRFHRYFLDIVKGKRK